MYGVPSRGVTPRSILEGRHFAEGTGVQKIAPNAYKDFYNQLMSESNQPQVKALLGSSRLLHHLHIHGHAIHLPPFEISGLVVSLFCIWTSPAYRLRIVVEC